MKDLDMAEIIAHLRIYATYTIAGAALFALYWLYNELAPIDHRTNLSRKHSWKLPPGPRGVPLLGNLQQFAKGIESNPVAFVS